MRTTDVVIVGAGVMGCSIAYHLAIQGTDVVVLDRLPQVGAGSTGLCSGGVRHQFSHPLNVQLSIESIRKLANFEDEIGQEIEFHRDGYLFLLTDNELVENYRDAVDMQQKLGVESRIVSVEEITQLTPPLALDDVIAAAYCPHDGVVDPHGVTSGYARAARKAGVQIVLDTDVTAVITNRDQVAGVETAKEMFSAPIIVNAAGPWAATIGEMAGLSVPVQPFPRYVWVTRGFENAPSDWRMVVDAASSFYFHREGEGVLMGMGAPDEVSSFDDHVDWSFLDRLIEVGTRRYPALADASIQTAWAGLYEVTPDHNPILGVAPNLDGYFMATGFSGHGFMHGPIVGEIIADQILGRQPRIDVSAFGLNRFSRTDLRTEQNVV
ncbi:MAG: FAD-binding oxidoreductase [bacterium]|nr:FAD-binding oxidoreductase [bacterium]